jgi:hypothetical protein
VNFFFHCFEEKSKTLPHPPLHRGTPNTSIVANSFPLSIAN